MNSTTKNYGSVSNIFPDVSQRAGELFEQHHTQVCGRTDRLFAYLMAAQFVFGVLCAVLISPRAWAGSQSHVHVHVWAAVLLGGLIASLPITLAILRPGCFQTRCVIAGGQMLTSALLIHLTGGRIETHFHVFGSLAFLAFYRDWRVFVPATLVVAMDHLVRGIFFPESVYGVLTASPLRSLEHAGWVIFEDIFLIRACILGVREMRGIAQQRACLEKTNSIVEETVRQRTAELVAQTAALKQEVADRLAAQAQREEMQKQLIDISRRAGMAEVATGVLHNVGNVLNSVNTSVGVVAAKIRKSEVPTVSRLGSMLQDNSERLGEYITADQKGKLIPKYLLELGRHLSDEQNVLLGELESLSQNIEHINGIVRMQQAHAKVTGLSEIIEVEKVMEDALAISAAAMERHGIRIEREYARVERMTVEKNRLLEILVNLISNAKHACQAGSGERRITLRMKQFNRDGDWIRFEIADSGVGIAPENMTRIFSHGFTTKKNGHGFGLHSASLAAKILGGSITAFSDGPGKGAVFTLELPLNCQAERGGDAPDDSMNCASQAAIGGHHVA